MPFTPVVFVDYKPIDAIPFKFTKCTSYPDAHTFMNTIYATTLPGFERIFTDTDDRAEILDSGPLLETVRDIIAKECIEPEAHDTANKTRICPLIDQCSLSIKVGNQISARRLTHANTELALKYAITNSCINEIRIIVGIHALHFCPGLNYLNWGDDICEYKYRLSSSHTWNGSSSSSSSCTCDCYRCCLCYCWCHYNSNCCCISSSSSSSSWHWAHGY